MILYRTTKNFSLALVMICTALLSSGVSGQDLFQQQQKNKQELHSIQDELGSLKRAIKNSESLGNQLEQQLASTRQIKEFHLIAKESSWELCPGKVISCLTYNGRIPGPVIRVQQGDQVKIVLHNQLKVPTSLLFHGLWLPYQVSGMPRKGAGLVGPGETFVYQFTVPDAGTYWYHPQVIHAEQQAEGLYGALIVEAAHPVPYPQQDHVMILGEWNMASKQTGNRAVLAPLRLLPYGQQQQATMRLFTLNGKTAPVIPPLVVTPGEHVRLRLINATSQVCPLYLTGHAFRIVSINGCDLVPKLLSFDTLCMSPGERADVEFVADNPGIWSFSSLLRDQSSNAGDFPGGIAFVVRYTQTEKY